MIEIKLTYVKQRHHFGSSGLLSPGYNMRAAMVTGPFPKDSARTGSRFDLRGVFFTWPISSYKAVLYKEVVNI